jgi:hypothetical protein
MPRETLTVCYYIADKGENCWVDDQNASAPLAAAGSPNAFELLLHESDAGKEIYLHDILRYFQARNSSVSGCSYRFVAYLNESMTRAIALNSPSAIVPVLHLHNLSLIILHMFPTAIPPIVPLSQIMTYASISRFQVYSQRNASQAESQVTISSDTSIGRERSHLHGPAQSKESSYSHHPGASQEALQNISPRPPSKATPSPHHHHAGNDNKSSILVNEEVTAMAEAAKEVAGAAARSFFNFAASTMKNVADISISSISAGATTVGKTKVIIIRELADGGFGKVFLVQDATDSSRQYAMKQMHCQSGNFISSSTIFS